MQALEDALVQIVEKPTEISRESLLAAMKLADTTAANPPDTLDKHLLHYLQRRSYAKALAHIRALTNS